MTSRSHPASTLHTGVAMLSGAIAGLVFTVVVMAFGPLAGGGPWWAFPRASAALVVGPELLPARGFDLDVLVVGLVSQLALSCAYALGIALCVARLSPYGAALAGLGLGLALYLLHFHVLAGLFPWFVPLRNVVTVLAHAAFGAIAAGTYRRLTSPRASSLRWAPEQTASSRG